MSEPTFGLVVFDDRLVPDNFSELAEGGQFAFAYLEDGPEPGNPTGPDGAALADLRPFALVAQERDVEVVVIRSGYPSRDGVSVATRPVETRRVSSLGSSDDEFMGWDDYVMARSWSTPPVFESLTAWDPANEIVWDNVVLTRIPGKELVVMAATQSTTRAPNPGGLWVYDVRNETWLTGYDWVASAGGVGQPIEATYDEEGGRLLFWHGPGGDPFTGGPGATFTQWVGYDSSDDGQTFGLYTRGFFGSTDLDLSSGAGLGEFPSDNGPCRLEVVPAPGEDWLVLYHGFIEGAASTGDGIQFASSDRLASARRITPASTRITSGFQFSAARGRDAFVVAYIAAASTTLRVRLLPSASTPFDDAASIVVASNIDQCRITADDDGILYIVGRRNDSGTDSTTLRLFRSLDGGSSWESFGAYMVNNSNAENSVFDLRDVVCAGGQLHVAGFWTGAGIGVTGGVSLLHFGGWSTVEADGGRIDAVRTERAGSGGPDDQTVAPDACRLWTPHAFPEQIGWFTSGVGGTATLTPTLTTDQGMQVTGSVQTWRSIGLGGAGVRSETAFQCKVTAVQLPARADAGAEGIRITLEASTGPRGCEVEIDVYSDGIRVEDIQGARNVGDVAISGITDGRFLYLRAYCRIVRAPAEPDSARFTLWYRFDNEERWTEVTEAVLGVTTFVTSSACSWGNGLQGTGPEVQSIWQMVNVTEGGFGSGLDDPSDVFLTTGELTKGITFGRPVPGGALRYPCPDLTTPGTVRQPMGFLAGRAGPGTYDERVILPVAHRYPIEAASPFVAPSPRRQWRSELGATLVNSITYDLGVSSERHLGEVLALVMIKAAPRQWFVDVSNGVGWTEVAVADLAIGSGLSWDRTGRWVRPRAGTATIGRYIHQDELVESGGWFQLDLARAARVVRNTAGYWSSRSGVQQVSLELQTVPIGTGTFGTDGALVSGSGVHVFTVSATPTAYRYVRIRCFASQVTPDGYEAGILAIGRVVGVGADPGWTWERRVELTRELTRRTDQLLEVRESGPARRVLSYGWPEGVILRELNREARTSEVAFPGFPAVGTEEDAHSIVTQLLVTRMQQGRVPAVVIPQLPDPGTTITDPFRWLYGRVLTDAHGITGVVGTEGVDEVVRVDGVTFEEIR